MNGEEVPPISGLGKGHGGDEGGREGLGGNEGSGHGWDTELIKCN